MAYSTSVVPETSTYALIFGGVLFGYVMIRPLPIKMDYTEELTLLIIQEQYNTFQSVMEVQKLEKAMKSMA